MNGLVYVDASVLDVDDEAPVENDGTVRCTVVGSTEDAWEVRLFSPTLERVWEVPPAAIVRFEVRVLVPGPIKRKAFERSHRVDPEWLAIDTVVYWCWCCLLQADRLRQGLRREFPPRGESIDVALRQAAATSFDEHSLLVAANNLRKALERAAAFVPELPSPAAIRSLKLLRDVYEHWEHQWESHSDASK